MKIEMTRAGEQSLEVSPITWSNFGSDYSTAFVAGDRMTMIFGGYYDGDEDHIYLLYRGYKASGFESFEAARIAAPEFARQVFDSLKRIALEQEAVGSAMDDRLQGV